MESRNVTVGVIDRRGNTRWRVFRTVTLKPEEEKI